MSALQGAGQTPCSSILRQLIASIGVAVCIVLIIFFLSRPWIMTIPMLLMLFFGLGAFGLNLAATMSILDASSTKSDYFMSCYDQLLLFYLLFAIATLMSSIFFSLYGFLYGLGGEVLRFYLTLLPVVITSLSIMFAVSFWVVNRVEGIAEDLQDDRLVRTTQNIKRIVVYGYAYSISLIFVFLPLLKLNTSLTSVPISISLSCPLGLAAGIIQALIVLDIVAVTLRRRLRRQR